MTKQNFIKKSQGYYGKYNPVQLEAVHQWLDKKSDRAIGLIWAEVLKAVSAQYRTPPGIKELEDAWRIVIRERNNELYPPALPEQPEERMEESEAQNYFDQIKLLFSGLVRAKNYRRKA